MARTTLLLLFYMLPLALGTGPVQAQDSDRFDLRLPSKDGSDVPFIPHVGEGRFGSYLAQNLAFAPFFDLHEQIEARFGLTLKDRGEAHITVVTPPEYFDALRAHVSIAEINQLAGELNMQAAAYDVVCLGAGRKEVADGPDLQTFFVVVQAPALVQLRQRVAELFVSRGGSPEAFVPTAFYPHVTLGFTQRDLHASDGIIKDARTCIADLNLID